MTDELLPAVPGLGRASVPRPGSSSIGSRWPVGDSDVPHEHLSALLGRAGRAHALRALSSFGSADEEDQQFAAISVGSAVELLAKAVIASTEPALLADRGDRDSLLRLTNNGHLAKCAAGEVRTLSGPEAVKMAQQLQAGLVWRPTLDMVAFQVRNAAAHMALVDADELQSGVLVMLRFVESLVPLMAAYPTFEVFWGEGLAGLATELLDEAKSRTRRTVAGKRAAAQGRLAALLGRLDGAARAAVLATLSGRQVGFSDHDEQQTCPVCAQQGWLACSVDRGPVEYDEAGAPFVEIAAYPVVFECAVCRLELLGEELDEFDFPTEFELEPDLDPAELEECEPDEDWLRGR